MNSSTLETGRGARVRVSEAGSLQSPPLVFLHGLAGLLEDSTFLDLLAERYHVLAPELPGYGESQGEQSLEDMLDFALHGWDVIDALHIQNPSLVGHSLGGMIAAEMACLQPHAVQRLVLIDPYGLWLEQQPIPDIFALLPYEFGELLFYDQRLGARLLSGAIDDADPESLRRFVIENARRLGTAGKILFPIPNRRLSKRLYRLSAETLVVWGEQDRLIPPAYAGEWLKLLPHAEKRNVGEAGHMLPYEQPHVLAAAVLEFLSGTPASDRHAQLDGVPSE